MQADLNSAAREHRLARVWTILARAIAMIAIVTFLVSVLYLVFANLALRDQLTRAYNSRDIAYVERDEAYRAWQILYAQVRSLGAEPLVIAPPRADIYSTGDCSSLNSRAEIAICEKESSK